MWQDTLWISAVYIEYFLKNFGFASIVTTIPDQAWSSNDQKRILSHSTWGVPKTSSSRLPRLLVSLIQIWAVQEALGSVTPNFSIAAAFGNVHGVYKPGNVQLNPSILATHQASLSIILWDGKFSNFQFFGWTSRCFWFFTYLAINHIWCEVQENLYRAVGWCGGGGSIFICSMFIIVIIFSTEQTNLRYHGSR